LGLKIQIPKVRQDSGLTDIIMEISRQNAWGATAVVGFQEDG